MNIGLGPCPVCDVSCHSGVSVADVREDIVSLYWFLTDLILEA